MSVVEDLLTQMLGRDGMTQVDRSVQSLFSALFHGVHGNGPDTGIGGLPDLVARFEKAGLGYIIQSWIGEGPSLPVTRAQLRAVLGHETVRQLTEASAREDHDILEELTLLLPGVVHRITHPVGQESRVIESSK